VKQIIQLICGLKIEPKTGQ